MGEYKLERIHDEISGLKKEMKDFSEFISREISRKMSERPFGMLKLPSKGLYYTNKNQFLLIGHLTYHEENILSSEMMHEENLAMPIVLNKVIINNDFDVSEILSCDVQAISMFLRAYAYGDAMTVEVECPHCGRKDEHNFRISDFKSRDLIDVPDEKGETTVITGKYGKVIKLKPRTYFEELEFFKNKDLKPIDSVCFNIAEYEGERDSNKIKKILSSLKIVEYRDIKDSIANKLPGINTNTIYECTFCEKETVVGFGQSGVDFLKLPASMVASVMEEMFLLSHYGQNITIEDIKKMAVMERRWLINRLSEELQKKKEAEEAAARAAKSKGRSKK